VGRFWLMPGIFNGPPNVPRIWTSLYEGRAVSWLVTENGRASSAELPNRMPTPPL
jgi:hypothetical protein